MIMRAVYIEQTRGPEVLRYGDRPAPEPGKGEVLVQLAAAGVNFTDLMRGVASTKCPCRPSWAPRVRAR